MPNIIGEMKTTSGKTYGTKVWHYWEHIGEHNENTLGIENNNNNKPLVSKIDQIHT